MTYLFTILLVVVAVGLLAVGIGASSTAAYLLAALASGLAFVLLFRSLRVAREHSFVTHPPPTNAPLWNEPVVRVEPPNDIDLVADGPGWQPPTVAIKNYEDLLGSEILPTLETLSVEELEAVILRERFGLHRETIISRAERLIDLTRSDLDIREPDFEPVASAEATPAPPRRSRKMRLDTPTVADRQPPKPPDLSI